MNLVVLGAAIHLVILASVTAGISTHVSGTCPAPYERVGDACYLLLPTPRVSQSVALQLCAATQPAAGRLLAIEDSRQYGELVTWLLQYTAVSHDATTYISPYGVWTSGRMLPYPLCTRYWLSTGQRMSVTLTTVTDNTYRCGEWALKLSTQYMFAAADWNPYDNRLSTVCQTDLIP